MNYGTRGAAEPLSQEWLEEIRERDAAYVRRGLERRRDPVIRQLRRELPPELVGLSATPPNLHTGCRDGVLAARTHLAAAGLASVVTEQVLRSLWAGAT